MPDQWEIASAGIDYDLLLIKWATCCMKCQFPYGIFKFVKDFQYHMEYYDIYAFKQVILNMVYYYTMTFCWLNVQLAVEVSVFP